ncbi:MAG: SDR family oxidoreductase [Gemmobacter sp.]|nr:SDR family oxidoreductase [Gemmobacter sp.]
MLMPASGFRLHDARFGAANGDHTVFPIIVDGQRDQAKRGNRPDKKGSVAEPKPRNGVLALASLVPEFILQAGPVAALRVGLGISGRGKMGLLSEKKAVVTGAARGLGFSIARGLAEQGAHVLVVDRDATAAEQAAEQLCAAGGSAEPVTLDISRREDVFAFGRDVQKRLGQIDVLVNNAGIAPRVRLDDPDLMEQWDRVIDINLKAQWDMTIALLPALRHDGASIVFVASIAAFTAPRSSAGYGAAKAGLRSLIQYFANELGPEGVRVNGLAPGRMLTDMTFEAVKLPSGAKFLDRVALKRNGEADEIAGPAVFLASSMSSYVTGVTIPVDGGFLAL